jgi:hypothetical protein
MKKVIVLIIAVFALAAFAGAQPLGGPVPNDVLGAHLNYGRGCAACHAPHSGARGNGYSTTDPTSGNIALWGQDASKLYSQTIVTGQFDFGLSYSQTFASGLATNTPSTTNLLLCLSCHDGNLAKGSMMKGVIYETISGNGYGSNAANIPTLLGNDGSAAGNYLNDHPVGDNATVGCGGAYNWDCTISATGQIQWAAGSMMSNFVNNYGFFVTPVAFNAKPAVYCTTCHDQHTMNIVAVDPANGNTGLKKGTYTSMFFLKAPYNSMSTTAGSNQTAQFCRQCHGGEANEFNNRSSAITTF